MSKNEIQQFQSNSVAVEQEIVQHISLSELHLPVPSIEKHHSRTITAGELLEAENFVQSGSIHLHKLKLSKGGDIEWEQVLSSRILAIAGTR